jgi:hypothetical protein
VKLRPKPLILLGFCRRRRLPKVPKKGYNNTYFFEAMSCLSRGCLKPNSARKSPLKKQQNDIKQKARILSCGGR